MRTHWIRKWGKMNGQQTKFLPSALFAKLPLCLCQYPLSAAPSAEKKMQTSIQSKRTIAWPIFKVYPHPNPSHFWRDVWTQIGAGKRLSEDKRRGMTAFFLRLDINVQPFWAICCQSLITNIYIPCWRQIFLCSNKDAVVSTDYKSDCILMMLRWWWLHTMLRFGSSTDSLSRSSLSL